MERLMGDKRSSSGVDYQLKRNQKKKEQQQQNQVEEDDEEYSASSSYDEDSSSGSGENEETDTPAPVSGKKRKVSPLDRSLKKIEEASKSNGGEVVKGGKKLRKKQIC